MKNLCIIGTGSQAQYVIENLKLNNDHTIIGLVDLENKENVGNTISGTKILCMFDEMFQKINPNDCEVIVGYGNNLRKKEIVEKLTEKNYKFATAINSANYISSYVTIGKGSIINPNVTILPNSIIGNHVIIHSGTVIEHDNVIDDFVNIAPGVHTAGYVNIGEGTYLYTGSTIIPKIKIGKWSVIAAGAVVITDVKDNDFVLGIPAKSALDKIKK